MRWAMTDCGVARLQRGRLLLSFRGPLFHQRDVGLDGGRLFGVHSPSPADVGSHIAVVHRFRLGEATAVVGFEFPD